MNLTMEPSPHKIPVPNSAPILPRSSQSKNNKNQHKRSHSKIYPPSPSFTVKFPTDISSSCSGSIPSQHYPQYYYNYPHHCPNPEYHFRHMSGFQVQQFAANSNNKDQFNRKRQRKHAAAATIVPDSIWNSNINNNNMGRKSTAQPRPVLHIPPRGIGPIVEPNENDVLCGRGGRINSHSGNVKFRDIINSRKKEYLAPSTKKLEKAHIAAGIVNDIRSMDPPGRFLKEDRGTGLWFDIGDAKAIKKTGQALREDAPDIRHELEGDDSSGDERGGALSPKVQGNKSPKTSPKISQSPKQMPPAAATSFPPPGLPVWPQVGNVITPQPSSLEYQAQMAMPPPSHNYSSSQQQSQQGNGSFETRNIPIPVPRNQPPMLANNFYQLPNQLYSGARSVTSKMTLASKHAIAALSPVNSNNNGQTQSPPDDIAFGRPFHPPEAAQTVLSSDHTMSTISGLSENLSSNMSGGEFRPSALMNMSLKSSGIVNNSLRLSSLNGFRTSNFGSGNNTSGGDSSMGLSGLSAINSLRGGGGVGGGGFHGESSLQRSLSMSSIIDGDHWRAIMEADDELLDETAAKSILSGGGTSAKHSLSSANSINRQRNSSAMSIGGLSMGGLSIGGLSMDLQSNASSTQWLAAVGLGGATLQSDDRTYMSNMSTELNALDLAGAGSSYRI